MGLRRLVGATAAALTKPLLLLSLGALSLGALALVVAACGDDSSTAGPGAGGGGSAGHDAAAGQGGIGGTASDAGGDAAGCSRAAIEESMRATLSAHQTDTDFSFFAERADGKTFLFERGTSSMTTVYESASTSKMVAAAVILRLVDQGSMKLDDTPAKYLAPSVWSLAASDPLYAPTLAQLLSFTSGLTEDALCTNLGGFDFETCVGNIVKANANSTRTPGAAFHYGGAHLQVAGAMAVKAAGHASWQALFEDFKAKTGLFTNAKYDLPSATNPRIAGGMHWSGTEYVDFLRAYKDETFGKGFSLAIVDQTATTAITNSPSVDGLGEEWHYGFGLWLECRSAVFDCVSTPYVSSGGAYGAYPFVNTQKDFFGIVARQGGLGSGPEGIKVADSVRAQLEVWATCASP